MKEEKNIMAMSAESLRILINAANKEKITKEDIITLTKENNEFVLIYYK